MQNALVTSRNPISPAITPPPLWKRIALLAGPVTAIAVSWLCTIPRDATSDGLTLANVALIMAVVTVGFAVLSSAAGVTTSIVAALALNYFHTEPYRTLRITDRRDVFSVALLAALGLAVSSITELRVRRGIRHVEQETAASTGQELSALLQTDHPAPALWTTAVSASAGDMALITARLSTKAPSGYPVVRRHAPVSSDPLFTLPQSGAVLQLNQPEGDGPWLIIAPRPDLGSFEMDRRVVLAFADAIELALASIPERRAVTATSRLHNRTSTLRTTQ